MFQLSNVYTTVRRSKMFEALAHDISMIGLGLTLVLLSVLIYGVHVLHKIKTTIKVPRLGLDKDGEE